MARIEPNMLFELCSFEELLNLSSAGESLFIGSFELSSFEELLNLSLAGKSLFIGSFELEFV